ncbi:unnamed protein product [Blepharisma stoltei]|uniref:Uncharacterized protein n=1 Tax=Blepharisma stoltei TaxID=1481888 RepID=A0AAU9KDG6_9CILI|nr:unnamed protein product [Blepharisma stoltei]
MSSSDFSSDSDFDMDVDEGTQVGTVQPSVQVSQAPRLVDFESSEEMEDSDQDGPPKITVLKAEKQPSSSDISAGSSDFDSEDTPPQAKKIEKKEEMKYLTVNKKPMAISTQDFTKAMPSPKISPINKARPPQTIFKLENKNLHTKSYTNFSDLIFEDELNPAPKPKSRPNDVERLFRYQAKSEAKLKDLANAQAKKIMEDCTFQPNIKVSKEKRSIHEFASDMERLEKNRQIAIEALRQEHLKALGNGGVKLKPTICKKSDLIAQQQRGRSTISVHEKLWRERTDKAQEQLLSPANSVTIDRRSFTPSINERSLRLERSESIENRLYNDALRRKRAASQSPETSFRGRLITKNSERFLARKFENEFSAKTRDLDIDDSMNYTKFAALLKSMSFIVDSDKGRSDMIEIWKILQPTENYVKKDNLLNALKGIMNYPLSEQEEGLLKLDRSLLHRNFHHLSENRERVVYHSNRNPRFKGGLETYSFRPSLNRTSSLLGGRSLSNRSFIQGQKSNADFLATEQQRLQVKWLEMKKAKDAEESKLCTFKPVINKKTPIRHSKVKSNDVITTHYKRLSSEKNRFEALYSLAKFERTEKERLVKSKEESEIEEDMKECTFTPKFETQKFNNDFDQVKGVSQLINKLRKGKMDAKKSKNEDQENKSIHKRKGSLQGRSDRQITTKESSESRESYQNSYSSEDDDTLTVSVNLPNGVVDTLIIYPNDNREEVVQKFIDKHGIDEVAARKLKAGLLQ